MRRWSVLGALLAAGLLAGAAAAQTVYKVTRPDGRVVYTDRRPEQDAVVEAFRVRAERQHLAQLSIQGAGRSREAVAANLTAGPLEVELDAEQSANLHPEPALPLRALLAPHERRTIATLQAREPGRPWQFALSLRAVPGDPGARHAAEADYQLPFAERPVRIGQGWNGAFSHHEPAARYAIDFALDEGSQVLAARAGRVIEAARYFEGAGLDREKFGDRANVLRILHDDGSMAVYAHLQPNSVMVREGAMVEVGQPIARSGNTGFSSGPHLHFVVQLNRGLRLESVPFRLLDGGLPLAVPDHAAAPPG